MPSPLWPVAALGPGTSLPMNRRLESWTHGGDHSSHLTLCGLSPRRNKRAGILGSEFGD